MISGPTYRSGNYIDLLFTYVSTVVVSCVRAPIGNSYHRAISFDHISDFGLPNITISRKVYLKSRDLTSIKRTDVFRCEDKVGGIEFRAH